MAALTQQQAHALYTAMCALNNVGARLRCWVPDGAGAYFAAFEAQDGGVHIDVQGRLTETHSDQAAFCAHYCLDDPLWAEAAVHYLCKRRQEDGRGAARDWVAVAETVACSRAHAERRFEAAGLELGRHYRVDTPGALAELKSYFGRSADFSTV